jgi:glycosyltransferase involved in cell wall biosynthesis
VVDDPDDATTLAERIRELLDDPAGRRAMSLAATRTAQRYDWPRVAAQVEELLLGLSRRALVA